MDLADYVIMRTETSSLFPKGFIILKKLKGKGIGVLVYRLRRKYIIVTLLLPRGGGRGRRGEITWEKFGSS
jgi:hypothetical protein